MNYYEKIYEKIKEFCETSPAPFYRTDYLMKAGKLYDLYTESMTACEEGVDSSEMRSTYEEICEIVG